MVGNDFLVRGYDEGVHFIDREKYSPTLYLPSNNKTEYKTLDGIYVEPIKPGTVKDCREFYKKYSDVENFTTNNDVENFNNYNDNDYDSNLLSV